MTIEPRFNPLLLVLRTVFFILCGISMIGAYELLEISRWYIIAICMICIITIFTAIQTEKYTLLALALALMFVAWEKELAYTPVCFLICILISVRKPVDLPTRLQYLVTKGAPLGNYLLRRFNLHERQKPSS